MRPRTSVFLLSLLFPLLSLAAKAPLENIELQWKPTSDFKDIGASGLGSVTQTVQVLPFKDLRHVDPTNKVGENVDREKKGVTLPVTTKTDIADFVSKNFKDTLHKSGLPMTEGEGAYVLSGDITEFFVSEVKTYDGTIKVNLTLSKAGKPIWKGTITGTNKRNGFSYREKHYIEALSDLVVDVATKLALSQEFKNQLK